MSTDVLLALFQRLRTATNLTSSKLVTAGGKSWLALLKAAFGKKVEKCFIQ